LTLFWKRKPLNFTKIFGFHKTIEPDLAAWPRTKRLRVLHSASVNFPHSQDDLLDTLKHPNQAKK